MIILYRENAQEGKCPAAREMQQRDERPNFQSLWTVSFSSEVSKPDAATYNSSKW